MEYEYTILDTVAGESAIMVRYESDGKPTTIRRVFLDPLVSIENLPVHIQQQISNHVPYDVWSADTSAISQAISSLIGQSTKVVVEAAPVVEEHPDTEPVDDVTIRQMELDAWQLELQNG